MVNSLSQALVMYSACAASMRISPMFVVCGSDVMFAELSTDQGLLQCDCTHTHMHTCIHDALQFKYAWVWGSSVKHQPQKCGREHILCDEDIASTRVVERKYLHRLLCAKLTAAVDVHVSGGFSAGPVCTSMLLLWSSHISST
jgi:hypothetical protein